MKINLYLLIIPLSLLFSVREKMNAQAPDFLWAKGFKGTGYVTASSIALDASGNIYTTGAFFGTVDFDPGLSGVFNLTSVGDADIFISKLDASGHFVWAKRIGGIHDETGNSIAIDASDHLYIIGSFSSTVDFNPDSLGVFNLTSSGAYDIFISKFDSAGNFVWAKGFGGINADQGFGIALDSSANIYATGPFWETVDFNPDPLVTLNFTSLGLADIFISKFDSSGNFIWAKTMGGTDNDIPFSIALDHSGNVYTSGSFIGTSDFNPDSSGIFNLNSSGYEDIFISKLDNSGNFIWAKAMGGTEYDMGLSLAIDNAGSGGVYTTGNFGGTADFDPDSSANFSLTSADYTDIFISKLDSSGNFIWAKAMGGTDADRGRFIAIDALGNIYTTGSFGKPVDFDPDSLGSFYLSSVGGADVFISKLNSSGNFVWAKAVGGTYNDGGLSMALDASGNVFVTGDFSSPYIDFGSNIIINGDTSGNTNNAFIAKLDTLLTTGNLPSRPNNKCVFLYPNPASNHLIIALTSNYKNISLTITDITGKIIYTTSVANQQKIEVNTKDFSEGIYLLRIQKEEFVETRKFVVAKE